MGTTFGSFCTLAVYRIPLGKDITHERSFCPNCNHRLEFLDLIPIWSYIFLGGKCRYCKKKIRIRYLILELAMGIVFVLFALAMRLNVVEFALSGTENILSTIVYFFIIAFYITFLAITAGIDKERKEIQTPMLLFGVILAVIYTIYVCVTFNMSMQTYVIYISLFLILALLNIWYLRKKLKNSYTIQNIMLIILMITFTYEGVTILSIILATLAIAIYILIKEMAIRKSNKKIKNKDTKIPIAFYLSISNILVFIAVSLIQSYGLF
jgi:leader peptidase (prepilin peptidase)/N-methyltransferase